MLLRILLLVFFLDDAFGAQKLKRQTSYAEVNPGAETILDCLIENKEGSCVWQKDRRVVGIYKGKYEWAGNPDAGDCSLRILSARPDLDDGHWECQVTATSFDSFDTINSDPIMVVVRIPPDSTKLTQDGRQISGKLSTVSGSLRTFVCSSENGNPAPKIRWFIGKEEVTPSANQTDLKVGKQWSSTSTLAYSFLKEYNMQNLTCVISHPALKEGRITHWIMLDVHYPPIVNLENAPSSDLEEGFDNLSLRCSVDSNPPAKIIWRKNGIADVISTGKKLDFYPLLRKNNGIYSCQAENEVGISEAKNVEINVKYAPVDVEVLIPEVGTVGGSAQLECTANSNPLSDFQFLQKLESIPETNVMRGDGKVLLLGNLSYADQGYYFCVATNLINGNRRSAKSQTKFLRITGPPQFSYGHSTRFVFTRSTNAIIAVEFCSDPSPNKFLWKSEGILLEPGEVFFDGKFIAEPLRQIQNMSCYEARLLIQRIDLSDANTYEIEVENDKGSVLGTVLVHIREPVPVTAIVGVISGCIVFLLIVTLCLLYAFRSDRWCFNDEENLKNQVGITNESEVKLRTDCPDVIAGKTKPKNPSNLRYSDLMLPRTSNNGSMRAKKGQGVLGLPSVTPLPSPRSTSHTPEDKLSPI
ncbi:hemicentin-2-like isoform X2 [Artemia franciscana]|uniref:hemicentin-2-like isoform X2 n=1 Tax=Artemia franciscana TaxID=6661 RepID=UPI0032DA6B53